MTHYLRPVCLLSISLVIGFSLYAADPTFQLKNKSTSGPIHIRVKQGNTYLTPGKVSIAKNKSYELPNHDASKQTTLELEFCTPKGVCQMWSTHFLAGHKIYIKFTGSKILPQKGDKKTGLTTEGGYSMIDNVKKISSPEIYKLSGAPEATPEQAAKPATTASLPTLNLADKADMAKLLNISLERLKLIFHATSSTEEGLCTACSVLGVSVQQVKNTKNL